MATTDFSLAELRALRPGLRRLDGGGLIAAAAPARAVEAGSADAQLLSDATRARQALGLLEDAPNGGAQGAADALSNAGRALSRMLAVLPRDAGPVPGIVPLLPDSSAVEASELARSLAATLANSGLFYESHLAAMVAGQLDRANIEAEPQARWAVPDHPASAVPYGASAATHHTAAASHAPSAMHREAQLVVARQLELHATGVFQWRGEAWPGVPMAWSVSEHAPHRAREPADLRERTWSTSFRLELPQLGAVDVHLRLCDAQLAIELAAAPGAAGLLRYGLPELRSRLTLAEFTTTACSVSAGAAT